MRKAFFITLFFLMLAINFSSAIKISPTQQVIKMNEYETNCTNIWVLPEANYSIKSSWSIDGKGDLNKYNLTAEKINLEIEYFYIKEGKFEFCFTPKKAGNFSGIIYFYDEKNSLEIGSWVDLKVNGIGTLEKINLISGKAISDIKKIEIKNEILAGVLVFLIGILFYLLVK